MGRLTNAMGELSESKFKVSETAEIMRRTVEALNGASELPITRITVPSAGGRYFVFSDDNGDMPPVNAFEGVILSVYYNNAYWPRAFGDGGDRTPFCSSKDGHTGRDIDGLVHDCRTCDFNRMGSGANGRGKACRNKMKILIMLEEEALPAELSVPTMSAPNYARYVASALTPRGLRPEQVTTKFGLMKATNGNGVDYSQIMFTCTGRVNDEEIRPIMGAMQPMLLEAGADAAEEQE